MKLGKGQHQEEEEEMEEEFGGKKDATSSNNCPKDGKNTDKANAIRSKHSVTEQRRRSKINERFHILRELIPNSDKKRDTASFLLEVIQYVQYLQDKVQKYEGPFQNWNSEPTKLMPWRNSHWSMQSFPSQHPEVKSPSTSGPAFPGRFDETIISMPSATHPIQQDPTENDLCRDDSRAIDHHTELANQTIVTPPPLLPILPVSLQNDRAFSHSQARLSSDGQSAEPMTCDPVKNPDELTIEGGTISISSIYSEGLLNTLTGALESTGLDLSQSTISVQINLGKQSNRDLLSGLAVTQDPENLIPSNNQSVRRIQDSSNGGNLNQAQKRVKM